MIPVGAIYYGTLDASAGSLPAPKAATGFWSISVQGTMDGILYDVGTNLVYDATNARYYKEAGVNPEWNLIQNIPEAATRWANKWPYLHKLPSVCTQSSQSQSDLPPQAELLICLNT